MHPFRQALLALLALLLLGTGPALAQATAGAAVDAPSAEALRQPVTNAEIRQWYNDQVAVIPALDEDWRRQGLGAEERARRAHAIRHDARVRARAFMQDKGEVAVLEARDREKYGNPDGPTFEYLVARNREKGLEGDAAYEAIVGSANRTNDAYNRTYGVQRAGVPPPRN